MSAPAQAEFVVTATDRATATLDRILKKFGQFNAPVTRMQRAFARFGRSAGLERFGKSVAGVWEKSRNVGGEIGSLMLKGAGVAATAGYLFKKQFLDVASSFEKMQAVLETTEGSQAGAKRAMDWVSQFAAQTPYELDQVTEAYVRLRTYGLDPTKGLMQSLGDTSAAMGKPLMQSVEAIADAVTGEYERLKELGIRASTKGNATTFAYTDRSGQQRLATVNKNNRQAIQQTLETIWNDKYAGAMGRLSSTWSGMLSNLMDQWTRFANMVMATGLFDWLKGKLSGWLDEINRLAANGQLQAWATKTGQMIRDGFQQAWSAGKAFFEGVQQFVGFVGGWGNAFKLLALVLAGPLLMSLVSLTTAVWSLGVALYATPVGWIVAGLAAVAVAATVLYLSWSKSVGEIEGLWDGVVKTFRWGVDLVTRLFKDFTPLGWIVDGIVNAKGPLAGFFRWIRDKLSVLAIGQGGESDDRGIDQQKVWQSVAPPVTPAPVVMKPAGQGGAGNAQTTTPGARIAVDFSGMPRGVRTTTTVDPGVVLDQSLGYSQTGVY
ncbi:tape measure protein [Jeongeupia naejangsanensis]|uniref:Tape measure protein N-terminal domain-containing protein n=1 Tax=Jeongeupia naejangsanensis TaxID=613195 RepID=A0ABS2BF91_9NEIS|nr:tape measure protein [Jeongeupia naejangsanensis]MBM3114281.1 hypothetical protein [Jeongeupia naejangsanensis]